MADWSLPREDLCARVRTGADAPGSRPEGFRPPRHERIASRAARWRVRLRGLADLQLGSIRRDLAQLLPQAAGTLADVGAGAQPFRDLVRPEVRYVAVDIEESEAQFGYRTPDTILAVRAKDITKSLGWLKNVKFSDGSFFELGNQP